MTESEQTSLVLRLRDEFDRSFSQGTHSTTETPVEMLGFRIGEGRYAVRLGQIATVQEIRHVTRIPGQATGLEGLIAAQGQLVAIYDLGILLRAPGNAQSRRWLIVSRQERQLGFAVDAIDGYLRKPTSALVAANDGQKHHLAVSHALEEEPSTRLLVDLSVLANVLRRELGQEGAKTP